MGYAIFERVTCLLPSTPRAEGVNRRSSTHASKSRTSYLILRGPGILFGNHAFLDDFYSDQISNNGTGVRFPGSVSDSREAISFFGTKFINSTTQGLNLTGFGDFFSTDLPVITT